MPGQFFLHSNSFLDLLPNYLTQKITPRRQEQCEGRNKIPSMRCDYGQDGTPIAEPYCVNIEDGCPVVVCCDLRTEEPCYDEATGNPLSCVRCVLRIVVASSERHRGSALCRLNQHLNMTLFYARQRYDKGGCPCPSGEMKCGESEYSSGYCTTLCCDWKTQATCYDGYTPISCRNYDDGPCSDHVSNSDGKQLKLNEPAVLN